MINHYRIKINQMSIKRQLKTASDEKMINLNITFQVLICLPICHSVGNFFVFFLSPNASNTNSTLKKICVFCHYAATAGHILYSSNCSTMRLCHPPDGRTSPKYKLLCFITTKIFLQREECTSF
jgi:hypothetical protein